MKLPRLGSLALAASAVATSLATWAQTPDSSGTPASLAPQTCLALIANGEPPAGSALKPWLEARVAQWLPQLGLCERFVPFLAALGDALLALGRTDEAAEHLERALLLEPDNPFTLQLFARTLAALGDAQGAAQLLGELLAQADAPASLKLQALDERRRLLGPAVSDGNAIAGSGLRTSPARPGLGLATPAVLAGANHPARAHPPAGLGWQAEASLVQGAETNLLGAASLTSLTLTLPGLNGSDAVLITVPVDPSYGPRSGGYRQAQLRLSAQWRAWSVREGADELAASKKNDEREADKATAKKEGRAPAEATTLWSRQWAAVAVVRNREVPGLPAAGFNQAELATEYTAGPGPRTRTARLTLAPFAGEPAWVERLGWYVGGTATALDSRTGVRFAATGVAAGLSLLDAWRNRQDDPGQGCDARAGLEAQRRAYASNPVLDSRYLGATAALGCRIGFTVRAGVDEPVTTTRPGGAQHLAGARLGARGQVAAWAWAADAEYVHTRDQAGYSPLIEQGARREQQRLSARLDAIYPLGERLGGPERLLLITGLEASVQHSNIRLFKTNNLGVFLGLKLAN